jgi:cobalt/nickel transport protein
MKKRTISLLLVCLLLVVGSYLVGSSKNGEFGGADDQIEDTIAEVNEEYEPWFESLWEPPSGEIESLLFALQAAIGAGFIGYYVGKKQNAKINNGTVQEE